MNGDDADGESRRRIIAELERTYGYGAGYVLLAREADTVGYARLDYRGRALRLFVVAADGMATPGLRSRLATAAQRAEALGAELWLVTPRVELDAARVELADAGIRAGVCTFEHGLEGTFEWW